MLLFCRYVAVQAHAQWVMRIWVPLVILTISVLCVAIEVRVGIQYIGEVAGVEWATASLKECATNEKLDSA
jgi:hypothetical protein